MHTHPHTDTQIHILIILFQNKVSVYPMAGLHRERRPRLKKEVEEEEEGSNESHTAQ